MAIYSYPVLAFRQQNNAPVQLAFVAHAADVLQWAGIPRKSDELLTGFQRFRDDKRVETEVVPFFQNPQNCSPTAVIVGLRRDTGLAKCRLVNSTGEALSESLFKSGSILSATLEIEIATEELASDALFDCALRFIRERTQSSDAQRQANGDDDEESDDGEDAGDEVIEDADADDADASDVSLGAATLKQMQEKLEDRKN